MTIHAPLPQDVLPPNVIRLDEARNSWIAAKCQHVRIEVDAMLAEVACLDCGAKLNPIAVLVRYAQEESRLSRQLQSQRDLLARLDTRVRCKCQHCGLMTRINA